MNRERKKESRDKRGKEANDKYLSSLELLTSLHIIIHTTPPTQHTNTHTQPTCSRKVMSLCDNVFSQSTLFRETEFVQ